MKLFANTTSPFVRLVRLAIEEKGLSDQVDIEIVDPWADPEHFWPPILQDGFQPWSQMTAMPLPRQI